MSQGLACSPRKPKASRWMEQVRMERRLILASVALVLLALLVGCGSSDGRPDTVATMVAEGVSATLAAEADQPVITLVVTLPPTVEPTANVTTTATPAPEPSSTPGSAATVVTPVKIHLEADGSGDYRTIEDAVRAAPFGATIILGPGSYHLPEALTITKGVTLAGAGEDQTEIVSDDAEFVLRFDGVGPFSAETITFRHEGTQPANVVMVRAGRAGFYFCRFTGGVFSAEEGYGGVGLFLGGHTTGQVYDSEATGNDGEGILIGENADIVVEASRSRDNGGGGITFFGKAAGTARRNRCTSNGLHGISLLDTAEPLLEENTCRHNGGSGIVYFGQARGMARDNDCSLNAANGIEAQGQAEPTLSNNRCYANGRADIAYYDSAGGIGRGNRCSLDAPSGILVAETASPTLSGNLCRVDGAVADSSSLGPSPGPRFNPDYLEGLGPMCFNQPEPTIEGEWQVGAEPLIVLGDSIELPLRNKWGESDETYQVRARVIAPDETESEATTGLMGSEDTILVYPDDFGATTEVRGTYTVIWEINGGFIACDGFDVGGGASW